MTGLEVMAAMAALGVIAEWYRHGQAQHQTEMTQWQAGRAERLSEKQAGRIKEEKAEQRRHDAMLLEKTEAKTAESRARLESEGLKTQILGRAAGPSPGTLISTMLAQGGGIGGGAVEQVLTRLRQRHGA